MPIINVIIPFFQRKQGILSVAVKSALSQDIDKLQITVVDDGSPVPAREELGSLIEHDPRIVIVEQKNGGPGAARNRGLDETPNDFEYVAFLDSDDRWVRGHLTNAIIAMRHGADFYFADADHHERGMGASRFAECGFGNAFAEPIGEGDGLFFFSGDLFNALLGSSPVGTSTVVFRRSIGKDLRFPEGLIFGEDKVLWMRLALASRRVAFSRHCEAIYGRGVNIYAAATWGTPEALKRIRHTAKVHRLIASTFDLSDEQRRWNSDWLREVRRSFAVNLVHLLNHRKPIDWSVVVDYFKAEPMLVRDVAGVVSSAVLSRTMKTGQDYEN